MESESQFQDTSGFAINQYISHSDQSQTVTKKATELNSAAESGNWTLVHNLLATDDVTKCDLEQCFLLHKLAAAPEVSLSLARDILTKILKHQVDINKMDKNEETAIVLSARCDNTKMVMELLSRKAALPPDVTHVCSFLQTLTNNWKPQETPYMHALVVKLLWDRLKDTALHSCHTQLHHTLVRLAVTFHTSLVRHMFVTQQQVNAVDSEGMAVLHRVAMFDTDDHVRIVHFLISKGADVNLQNTTGDTPLQVAVKYSNWIMMATLLRRRANSDVVDCKHRSVLQILASDIDPKTFSKTDHILPLLIRNSNDINKKDGEGNTALHLAALAGNITFMKTLLDHGARADSVNDEQKTVLHMMAMTESKIYSNIDSRIKALLFTRKSSKGVHKRDFEGNSALHLAAKHEHWPLVKLLLQYVDEASQPDSEGFNILHRFSMRPNVYDHQMFYQLSQKVGNINTRCQSGDSPIHLAAKCQNWDIVKLLVEEGALMDELDNEGFHVLHRFVIGGERCSYLSYPLLLENINLNIRSLSGQTVLHLAARHDNWPMVKYLVEQVENIDETDSEGFSLIQRLVMSNKDKLLVSLFCRLLELGADYTCRDQKGDTVLHLAAKNGHWEIVEYLVELGEQTDTPDSEGFLILHRVAAADTHDSCARGMLFSLLKHKPDLDKRNKHGDRAVHVAAKNHRWETVATLIENGANAFDCDTENIGVLQRMFQSPSSLRKALSIVEITVKTNKIERHRHLYETLLFEAARCGRWDEVQYLVEQGISTHQRDSEGLTLLHVVAKTRRPKIPYQNSIELDRLLRNKSIVLHDKCPNGNTPLHLAAKFNNWDVVKNLLLQGANIQGPDSDGLFVLQRLAMCSDYCETQRILLLLLIKNGADVKIRRPNRDSLLHLGAKANNWLFVSHIMREIGDLDLNELDSDGFNIMHRLAQSNTSSQWAEEFLKKGLNLDTPNSNGDTCLLVAAQQENWTFVKCLLGHMLGRKQPSGFMLQRLHSNEMVYTMPSSNYFPRVQINLERTDLCGYTVWHFAVLKQQWDIVELLIECGAKTSIVDNEGLNLLQRLASQNFNVEGWVNFLKPFIEKGFSFARKDGLGNTLLQNAAKHGNFQMIAFLLNCAEDVCSKDADGLSLLHRVVQIISPRYHSELEKIVERLLKSGAHPEEISWDGNTPLHLAAKNNKWPTVRLMLNHGARASICDSEGLSILHRLARQGQTHTILLDPRFGLQFLSVSLAPLIKELLRTGASMKQKDLQGNTPLQLAVQHQSWEVAQELVQLGAEVNELDPEGYTVFHRLAQTKDPSQSCLALTRILLDKGARWNIPSKVGETIVDIVAENENWSMMKCLLNHGLFTKEKTTNFLLHRLASCRDLHAHVLCDLLIEKGLSVDAEDLDRNTPLHLAARAGNWDLVKHLIQKGANGRMLDKKGLSVLHKFVSGGCKWENCHYLDVIISSGVDANAADLQGNTALNIAAKRGLIDIVERLVSIVNNLNTRDSDGFTVLMRLSQATRLQCLPVCQSLIDKGADINIRSADGESALELAVKNNNWPVVEFLLSSGAQFEVKVLEQLYTIHRLIKCSISTFPAGDQLRLMTLLTNIGLSITIPDSCGRTPSELAITHKKWKLFKYFLQLGAHLKPTPRKGNSLFHELAQDSSVGDDFVDITHLLTKCGLDINLRSRAGDTPVHVAANTGKWDIAKTFVECGADTNKLDRKGYCLLHKLVHKRTQENRIIEFGVRSYPDESRLELLRMLIKHGADVNWLGPDSKTALQTAASENDWEMVGGLIDLGAFCELTPGEKQTAFRCLHCFTWKDVDEEKLKRFINYITNDACEINNTIQKEYRCVKTTVLQKCVENANWRISKTLIECGADVFHMYTNEQLLQLMISRYSQSDSTLWTSFFDLLLSRQLDINIRLQDGSGILFQNETITSLINEQKGTSCLFDTLMERGANPLLVDSRGQTLLRKVGDFSRQHTLNALKKLLPAGVTTHQPRFTDAILQSQSVSTAQTASPTEKMIQNRNIHVLKMLIKSGASSNAELFRLNTEYQVKLAGQVDTDVRVRELLEVLNIAASQPRSLQSLCRLTISHCVGCGPGRTDKLNSLPIPPALKELILFRDVLSQDSLSQKREDVWPSSPEYDDDFMDSDDYCDAYGDSDDDEIYAALLSMIQNGHFYPSDWD